MYFLVRNSKKQHEISFPDINNPSLPTITLLVAAYNEASFIEKKIENTLSLIYPPEKLKIVIVADGSNDSTISILSRFPEITVYFEPERRGKAAAINRVMPFIETEIVVFNDANTLVNKDALLLMARHYENSQVGGVSGEKRILKAGSNSVSGSGEGMYWRYESLLKRLDAQYFSIIGAAGELFSIRTNLYESIDADTILDDFIISLRINEKGFRIAYEPDATASEEPSIDLTEERKRKIRICAGGFQAMSRLPGLWRFDKHFSLSFMYLSHRVSRWTFAPLALLLLPFINLFIVLRDLNLFFGITLTIQLIFYVGSLVAYYYSLQNIKLKGLYICYYFLFMNISVLYGFFRFLKGTQSSIWEKAKR